ncbi:MAG: glycosyltransferase family 2 protein [Formivibrio sp.]|nr:glycosyltransferase family 2 protein [Formivibrio sp.]
MPDKPSSLTPFVSIVMPCRNEADHIPTCVAELLALEGPVGGFEVIVADGLSDDGTWEILARLEMESGGQQTDVSGPVIRVIDNPGRITPCGLNAAIRAARGKIIVRVDAHTTYAPDYLLKCLETLTQTGADNVGGPARTKADGYRQRAVAAAYHSPFSVGGARFHNIAFDGYVDTVTYGCWPRSTFEKFGLFDEELVRNQDDEHNLRIIRAGGKVFQSSKIKSWYSPRRSFGALFKQYMQYGYWKVRVIQKHKLPASWRHIVPGAFVLSLALLPLLSVFCWFLYAMRVLEGLSYISFELSAFGFIFICSAYFLAVLAASVDTSAKTEWKLLPVLPVVFGCYHLGYGFGFLRGIWDFVILRRRGSSAFSKLTRGSLEPRSAGQTDP